MNYSKEKEVALKSAIKTASLCRMVRADMIGADAIEKSDNSPVTVADFGSQALICNRLKSQFPNDPIVGEEDSAVLRSEKGQLSQVVKYVQRFHPDAGADDVCDWIDTGNGVVAGRYWTLDPIDGTKGFLRGDQYAVALALIEEGDVKVGVLVCPELPLSIDAPEGEVGSVFVAVRGQGTKMAHMESDNFRPVNVARGDVEGTRRFVESFEPGHSNQKLQSSVAREVGIEKPPLRMDSQAKYGTVARGDSILYLRTPSGSDPDYSEKIWDHAAGSLVVEEAGGKVTDIHGKPLDFATGYRMEENTGVVASNGLVHSKAIEALKDF